MQIHTASKRESKLSALRRGKERSSVPRFQPEADTSGIFFPSAKGCRQQPPRKQQEAGSGYKALHWSKQKISCEKILLFIEADYMAWLTGTMTNTNMAAFWMGCSPVERGFKEKRKKKKRLASTQKHHLITLSQNSCWQPDDFHCGTRNLLPVHLYVSMPTEEN